MLSAVSQLLDDNKRGQTPKRPVTSRVPESAVLAQLRCFLPQMQSANQQLAQRGPSEPAVSISDLQEGDSSLPGQRSDEDTHQHVQMDIACGVLDLKDEAALRAAEAMLHGAEYAASSDRDSASASDSERNSESEGDDDADMDPNMIGMGMAAHDAGAKDNKAIGQSGHQCLQNEADGARRTQSNCTGSQARQNPSKILEL